MVRTLDASAEKQAPRPLVPGSVYSENVSPDSHWVVYSRDGGLFVQAFPGPEPPQQIGSGSVPRWRADGAEILALDPSGRGVLSIRVDMTGAKPSYKPPESLFRDVLRTPSIATASSIPLAVSRDGSSIYWLQPVEQPGPDAIHVRTRAVK